MRERLLKRGAKMTTCTLTRTSLLPVRTRRNSRSKLRGCRKSVYANFERRKRM